MKKYLVGVYFPASGQRYDAYLPAGKRIDEVIRLLIGIAEVLSGGSYQATADAMLLDAVTGKPFRPDMTVYDTGIRNASQLILI